MVGIGPKSYNHKNYEPSSTTEWWIPNVKMEVEIPSIHAIISGIYTALDLECGFQIQGQKQNRNSAVSISFSNGISDISPLG